MAKTRESRRKKDNYPIYILMFACFLLLILFFANRTTTHYDLWRQHQGYFRNNQNASIESWMTPNTVLRHFSISEKSLFSILNVTDTNSNLRTPILTICAEKKMNCTLVVDKLNMLVK